MKWDEASRILKGAWEEKLDDNDGSYFKEHIKEIIGKKDIFFEAAKKYGTPQYILDEEKLKKKAMNFMSTFRSYMPNSDFFYAFKSNDLPYLIKRLKSYGYNADVASLFELQLALKIGFDKIIFTGPGKSDEELKLAINNRDKVIINIDNEDELDRIMAFNEKARVSIRVNFGPDAVDVWSKFGISLNDLKRIVLKAREKLELAGFHFHSSWNDTPERYCNNIKMLGEYLKKNKITDFEFLDIGGGIYPEDQATLSKFSHKYMLIEMIEEISGKKIPFDFRKFSVDEVDSLDEFGRKISSYLRKYIFCLNKDIKIYFEPGRRISNNPTHILLKVIAEKDGSVIVDGGMNLVGGLDFYDYAFSPIINLSNPSFKLNKKIIYGSLCKATDLWGYSFFGKDCKKGDLLIVLMQGSYSFSRAWRLIKENAPYTVFDGKKLFLAKEREKFSDRYAGCKF